MVFENEGFIHELEKNVVVVHVKKGKQKKHLIKESILHLKSISNSRLKILCIPAPGTYINRELREYVTDEYRAFTKAFAIIQRDLLVSLTMNMIQKVNRPPYPTKVFRHEEEAIEWLNSVE